MRSRTEVDHEEGRDVTDAELLVGSVDDVDRFGALYDRHERAMLGFFYRRTGCAQTAADLTAETFAAAFTSRRRFTDTGAPAGAWLFTIARRQLARYLRAEEVGTRARRRLGAERVVLTDDAIERVEELVDLAGLGERLRNALAELSDAVAAAVRLRVLDGLAYAAVADELGCTEGAARVRVARGLAQLAEQLDDPAAMRPPEEARTPEEPRR
ncbi:MAG: RNA polymerase sigma factor [Actinomycetota bacterium]|nr:RNA polymerase sigma factor [Actinomycetota bacterium]